MMGDYGGSSGWGWTSWLLMTLTMLVILAVIVWGLVQISRRSGVTSDVGQQAGGQETPKGILEARLARGEIEVEEYQRLREQLVADAPHAPK